MIKKNVIIIYFFMVFSLSNIAWANTPTFIPTFNTESYNSCIVEDKDGFMWVGTVDGLVKYNGYKRVQYNYYHGAPLESNIVTSVFVDSENLIWLSIATKGLYSYNKLTDKFIHYTPDNKDENTISSTQFNWTPKNITEDKDGLIWIGTKSGLNSYDKKNQKFTRYTKENCDICDNNISTVYVDRDDLVWIGTANGLSMYNKKTKSFITYRHYGYDPNNSLVDNHVLAVAEDKGGNIWIGTKDGLSKYDRRFGKFTTFKHTPSDSNTLQENNIFSLLIDKDDNLWICHPYTVSIGVEKYDIVNNQFSLYSVKENNGKLSEGSEIQSCFEDRQGNLWLVDNISMIYQKNSPSISIFTYKHNPFIDNGLKCDDVLVLTEDNSGTLWIGSRLGIYKFDDKTNKIVASDILKNNKINITENIFSMLEDRDGLFWVGTYDGHLYLFDKNKKFIRQFENKLLTGFAVTIIQDSNNPNIYWIGSEMDGFFKLDKRSGLLKQYRNELSNTNSISNNTVSNIFQDNEGIIWLPTLYGLNRFDPISEKFTKYIHDKNNDKSISGNAIKDCYIDSRNNFWITTDDGGLNKFDKKYGIFKHFETECNIPTKAILAILEDDTNRLWMSTLNNGIIVFDILAEKVVKIYDISDGLQGNSFSHFIKTSCKRKNGEVWFSGLNGITRIKPNVLLNKNTYKPPIFLTSFSCQENSQIIQKQPIDKVKKIALPWNKNSFEFEFVALNYIHSFKNQYAYKLEGLEKDWNYIGTNHSGRYTNISPGEYILRLKGSNNDGVWNEEGISIKITITPPFWMTWWFKGLVGIVILSIIGGVFQLRTRSLKKKAIYIRDHTAQVAHDIRSPLAALSTALKDLKELPEQKRILIRNATRRISDIANNLLIKYKVNENKNTIEAGKQKDMKAELVSSLLDSLVSEKRVLITARSVEIILDLGNNTHSCFVNLDPEKFKRVISNLINNSSEAIGDKGVIRVVLNKQDNDLIIKIIDNGKGIPEDILPKIKQRGGSVGKKEGCGLGISEAIKNIKKWNGTYDIQSTEGKGTTFTITLPITEEPDWFQNSIILSQNKHIIVLDDDESIHNIWQIHFFEHIGSRLVALKHFYESSAFVEYCKTSCSGHDLFLVDYELGNHKKTGLDLIEQLDLKGQTILVTSRYEELEIRERIKTLGIKIIPKNFAPYIPIFIVDEPVKEKQPELIFIDDDKTLTEAWEMQASFIKKKIATFNCSDDFKNVMNRYNKDIPIYIDSDLKEQIPGEFFARFLYDQGFHILYLATGYEKDRFGDMPWIKNIVNKEAPF